MMLLRGADFVLSDRVVRRGHMLIRDGHIARLSAGPFDVPSGTPALDLESHTVVPGFVDVHVHGIEGADTLDGPDAVAAIAARLPAYGVTSFCPTTVACTPDALATVLDAVRRARASVAARSARVLGAHLESNFINPDWRGAQPLSCLRRPRAAETAPGTYAAGEILAVIEAFAGEVAIVTLAPELEGGIDLVRRLVRAGHVVSIGHSGASYDDTMAAIDAGVTHATHLFNRMTPLTHRAPGVVGAVLASDRVAAELICDGAHVHPAAVLLAIRAKSVDRCIAITDGTAGSGLPVGATARIGGQRITVGATTALLDDGTLAGSVLTMDGAFRLLVETLKLPLPEAARLCATNAAVQVKRPDLGRLVEGAPADLAVFGPGWRVRQTFVAGQPALEL
jgi:N-acetylglucosamine-6-phosphate deacetylase